MKKLLKWLIPSCLAVILVVVALLLFPKQQKAKTPVQEFELYWNVEASAFRLQNQFRYADANGIIYVTLSHNGKQARYPIKDNVLLANAIDQLDVMCLEFDDEGYIVDCIRVEEAGGKILAKDYGVTSVEGNAVICNSSVTGRGYDVKFELTDAVDVWDVSVEGITCGIQGSVHVDDMITVVQAPDQSIAAVYTKVFTEPKDIYWNVDRKYDSVTKTTTREMDVTGGYTITVAVNGELTTVRTRDYEMVQAMDAMTAKCFALEFDENGMVCKVIHAGTAAGGGSCASWYRVDEYSDTSISATKTSTGATYTGSVSANVVAYDVSGQGDYMGQPTTVRVGDTVHCLKDARGRVAIIFVVRRVVQSELYWNLERKWDGNNSVTTRRPAADGWYYVDLAVGGKQITVKTQDKELVQAMDARPARCFGLKLDGDVIQKVYMPDSVTGGATFASWYDVTSLNGKTITCIKPATGDVRTGTMREDCQIYNVSTNSVLAGEVTTLQVGDKIHSLKDGSGQICAIFVVNRYVNYPTYYNLERKWDDTQKCTTRTPDSDGYYVFLMAYNGQQVTVKTKSKSVANDIDSQAARCVALSVADGIVYKAIHPQNTNAYKGGPTSSYTTVTKLSKSGFSTQKVTDGVVTKSYNETFASNCKIYNVSNYVISHKGEPTTLQVGDYVHCLKNGSNQVAIIFVLTRYENMGVYYNLDRKWDDTNQVTTRTADADGYYVFAMAHEGEEVTVKTTSLEVANAIDSQVARVLGLEFDNDRLVTKAIHAQYTQACKGGIGASYETVTAINGNQVTTEKDGNVKTFTVSENPNIFDVSATYKVNRGETTTLRVGDYIHCLENGDNLAHYIYVLRRVAVIEPVEHSCQHVTEPVTWYEWDGASSPADSGYYVLTQNSALAESITIPEGKEITICLNGHTVTSDVRMFKIYGTLNLCDHKDAEGNYKGKLSSSYSNTVDENGNVTTKAYGALAYLYNTTASSRLNIYGGIYEHTGQTFRGGLVYIGNKQDVPENTASFYLYDGVLTGGNAVEFGGAVMVTNNGHFVMQGGKITNSQSASGGAVAINNNNASIGISGGVITGNASTGNGAAVHMDYGLLTMNGGMIVGNTATGSGGGVNVQGGRFEMTGGVLDSNSGTDGGNIRINKSGEVLLSGNATVKKGSARNGGNITMFGKLTIAENAAITGGVATNLGSAISLFSNYADSQVELNILGGNIDGVIRFNSSKGRSVVMNILGGTVEQVDFEKNDNATVERQLFVGGTANVKLVNLAEGKQILIHEKGLDPSASIVVAMANTASAFATITDPADAACFHPQDETLYMVENVDNQLYLSPVVVCHSHCLCNGKAVGLGDHVCDKNATWTAWTNKDALPTDSGNYYLDVNVTLNAMFEMKGKLDLKICLNGHTITGPGGGKRAFLLRDADLSITDCTGNGVVTNEVTSSLTGGLIYQYSGKSCNAYNNTVNLYGGTLTTTGTAKSGGVLYLGNDDSLPYYATFNMYGGTVTGGKTTAQGGNITMTKKSQLNLYGGVISDGEAGGVGGNISQNANAGAMRLLGGQIIGNDVFVDETVILGGQVQIDRLNLRDGHSATLSDVMPLTGEACVGIVKSKAELFATAVTSEDMAEFFKQVGTSWSVVYDLEAQTLSFAQ